MSIWSFLVTPFKSLMEGEHFVSRVNL